MDLQTDTSRGEYMSKTKKSRPSVTAPGRRSGAETACGAATTSTYQNTTQRTGKQPGKIERLLSHGVENAVPLHHLVTITELPAAKSASSFRRNACGALRFWPTTRTAIICLKPRRTWNCFTGPCSTGRRRLPGLPRR